MSIAILCPSYNRPAEFKRMMESAYATADKNNISILLYTTQHDEEWNYPPHGNGLSRYHGPDWPTVQSWNHLAEAAMFNQKHKLFMLAADDMVFKTPGWDTKLLNLYDGKPHVYALHDSRDEDGTPHPIVSREYIQAMGYFLPPIFLHWFIDTWTVEIAKANHCFTHLKDIELEHIKPWDDGKGDETHMRIRRAGWLNRDQYVNKHCQHFLELEKTRLSCAFG